MEPNARTSVDMAITGEIDLTVIIVNWNSLAYLRGCLCSLPATGQSFAYEVIVVDNQSTDDSRRALKTEEFSGIQVLLPDRNLGFVRANNLAARAARGRNLLFLNPDTLVVGDALTQMTRALDEDDRLGIVGCLLLNGDQTVQTTCVQPIPTLSNQLLGLDFLRQRFPRLSMWGIRVLSEPPSSDAKPVAVVSGACLMIKRRVFDQLGGFSRDYYMYAEEVDLCYAAAKAGWRVGHVGEATVVHFGGQSSNQVPTSSFADVLITNSVFTFLRKTRGRIYAQFYRVGQGVSGVCRLLALGVGYAALVWADSPRVNQLRGAIVKWAGITRWAIGLEKWTNQLTVDTDK